MFLISDKEWTKIWNIVKIVKVGRWCWSPRSVVKVGRRGWLSRLLVIASSVSIFGIFHSSSWSTFSNTLLDFHPLLIESETQLDESCFSPREFTRRRRRGLVLFHLFYLSFGRFFSTLSLTMTHCTISASGRAAASASAVRYSPVGGTLSPLRVLSPLSFSQQPSWAGHPQEVGAMRSPASLPASCLVLQPLSSNAMSVESLENM